jgi:hypothetical protein
MQPSEMLSPEALELILSKETKEISDEEIEKMILHFRIQREKFLLDESVGKKATSSRVPSAKAIKGAEALKMIEDLDLGDI